MKRSLLILTLALLGSVHAQNVTENKVTFTYIQLPTNPIDNQYTTYEVVLVRGWEQSNEDSLSSYQIRMELAVNQYESEMDVWKQQTSYCNGRLGKATKCRYSNE